MEFRFWHCIFFIASPNLYEGTTQGQKYAGIYITIDESELVEGKSAIEILIDDIGEKDFIEMPKATTINGHDASQAIDIWADEIDNRIICRRRKINPLCKCDAPTGKRYGNSSNYRISY